MLTAAIYPMPYYDAPHALRVLLTNPLLLHYEPELMEQVLGEQAHYDKKQQVAMACHLLARRDRINNQYPAEPRDREGESEMLVLCESKYVRDEKTGLRRRILLARPSEYPWLRGLIEEAITTRADAEMAVLAAA